MNQILQFLLEEYIEAQKYNSVLFTGILSKNDENVLSGR